MNSGWSQRRRAAGARSGRRSERRPYYGRPAAGFTLLEFVIVLTVVGILVAMGIPAMRRAAAKSELRDAAGRLRVALAKARLEAIETGVVQTFRYEPNTGRFVQKAHPVRTSEQDSPPSPQEETLDDADIRELPDGVVFLDPDDDDALPMAEEAREQGGAAGSSGRIRVVDAEAIRSELTESNESDWSRPIVFYPTGRTSNARFRLLGACDYWIELQLRGLTGSVAQGELQRPRTKEDLEKQQDEKTLREEERPETLQQPDLNAPLPETSQEPMEPAPLPAESSSEERQP